MTAPYYTDGDVRLYLGSCIPLADRPEVPVIDEWLAADVLITDPPYGMEYQSHAAKIGRKWVNGDKVVGDENTDIRDAMLHAWWAHTATRRAALVFGTWKVERPAGVRQLIVWDKGESPGMGDLSLPWGPSHEDIYAMGTVGFVGRRGGSVLRVPGYSSQDPRRPNHPTPKPPPLYEQLARKTVGVMADPFGGSGPLAVAAKNLGRSAVIVELDEAHCEGIARRLEATPKPLYTEPLTVTRPEELF